MFLANPIEDLVPGPRGKLLAALAQLEVPVTIRALSRHAGVAAQTALTVVNDLAEAGLVSAEPAGRAQMVALRRSHLAAEPLLAIAHTRARLVARLAAELREWEGLRGAWLFGSAARGTGDRMSDVDLMLVTQASLQSRSWSQSVEGLIAAVEDWTGNQAQVIEHTVASFGVLVRQNNPLIESLRIDGIPLRSESVTLLRRPQ